MASKGLLQVLVSLLAFAPFGAALVYVRTHGRDAPPFDVNLGLFVFLAAMFGVMLYVERRFNIFKETESDEASVE